MESANLPCIIFYFFPLETAADGPGFGPSVTKEMDLLPSSKGD